MQSVGTNRPPSKRHSWANRGVGVRDPFQVKEGVCVR